MKETASPDRTVFLTGGARGIGAGDTELCRPGGADQAAFFAVAKLVPEFFGDIGDCGMQHA